MPETLLILGASRYHLELIRAGREIGARVIIVDGNPDAPGRLRADLACLTDPFDLAEILEISRDQGVTGVLAATSSATFLPAAWLAATLGLRGINPEIADTFADKAQLRDLITKLGLPHPLTHVLREGARLPKGIFDGSRWVLHPDRGWASRGVFVITTQEQFEQYYPITLALSPANIGMLERHMGAQVGLAQGILAGGKVERLWVADRTSAAEPYTSVASLRMPSRLPQHLRKALTLALEMIFGALEIADCVFHADFVAGDGKVYVLGMAPTLAGYGMAELIRGSSGAEVAKYAVLQALGKSPELPALNAGRGVAKAVASLILGVAAGGRLEFDAEMAESFLDIGWIAGLSWDKQRGSTVKPYASGDHRVGKFTVTADNRDQLDARIDESLRRLNVRAV